MPCQIGQNIYQLRKKNRQLLEQLESNSVLLENKIKRLRHSTRTSRKCNLKNDVQTSPKKKRHQSWDARNGSSRVASAVIEHSFSYPEHSSDNSVRDHGNIPGKSSVCNSKKTYTKCIRRNLIVSNSEIKKPSSGQSKGKMQPNMERKVATQCYCSKMHDKHAHHVMKKKGNTERYPKKGIQQLRDSNRFNASVSSGTQVDGVICDTFENDVEVPDLCAKCVEEARHLLTYSPESLFLRRMKEKVQKFENESIAKDYYCKITQICNCGNTQIHGSDSDGNHSHCASRHVQVRLPKKKKTGYGIDVCNSQEDANTHSATCVTDHDEENCIIKEKCEHKSVQVGKKSKEWIDMYNGVSIDKDSVPQLASENNANTNTIVESKENIQPEDNHRVISDKNLYIEETKKCLCKKEIGGLCCCEVLCTSNSGNHLHSSPNDDTSFFAPLKSSKSAPVVPILKSNTPAEHKQSYSEKCGSTNKNKLKFSHAARSSQETEQQIPASCDENKPERNLKFPRKTWTVGYDVIADLMENEHNKYSVDPCIHHLEELSQFRQKHWFDCHAHPHGVATSELCSDSKESYHVGFLDDDPMQPTKDPCIRSYRLNKRLFPEMIAEVHGAGCCIAEQGACVSPNLLPTQRRLITLPVVPLKFTEGTCETMKMPPGIQYFPKSNVLIRDPIPSPPACKQLKMKGTTARRSRQPVPSNSLALRFQKGIA